jgi:hypothetical protein
VRSSAPAHWVQTPNRYFPIEPHFLFPGFQFLSVPTRAWILRRWPLVHTRTTDRVVAIDTVIRTELIGRTEFAHLFPDSDIERERMLGLTKSFTAIGDNRG